MVASLFSVIAVTVGLTPIVFQVENESSPHSTLNRIQKPKVLWTFKSIDKDPEGSVGLGDACIADGVLYVGDDAGRLTAVRSRDGKKLWSHSHGERIYNSPISDGKLVFVATSQGVEAVDCKTGKQVWRKGVRGTGRLALWPRRPAAKGKIQTLFVGSDDGMMYGFFAPKGNQLWKGTMMDDVPEDPAGFDGERARFANRDARPRGISTDGRMVFQGVFDQCRVVAFGAYSGKVNWTFPTKGWVGPEPTVDGDRVYIGSQDKTLYCVRRETGEQLWDFKTGSRISSAAAAKGDQVFIPSCDGRVYCLHRNTGKEIWNYDTTAGKGRSAIYCQPLVTRSTVYVAIGRGLVYAIDVETGELRWKFRPLADSELYCPILTDGEKLFVTSRPDNDKGAAALIAIGADEE